MADFETTQSVSGARASQIDEGLKAHMNKVYGTMSVGMIITALAAWAISGLATTTDPALAVGQMQNGTMLTGLGATIYTSPLRWVIMLAPLAMIFGFGAVMRRSTAQAAQLFFYIFATLIGVSLSSIFIFYTTFSITQTFPSNLDRLCRFIIVGLHNKERYFRLGFVLNNGSYRSNSRYNCKLLFTI
jgi:FtsH-binding integral membrane protein